MQIPGFKTAIVCFCLGAFYSYHIVISEVDLTIYRVISTVGAFAVGYFLFAKVVIIPWQNTLRRIKDPNEYIKRNEP